MATDNYGFIELVPNEKFSLINDFNQLAQQVDAALKTIANAETENANKIATLNTNLQATNNNLQATNTNLQATNTKLQATNTNLQNTNTKLDSGLSSVNMNIQTLTENVGVLSKDIVKHQINGSYRLIPAPTLPDFLSRYNIATWVSDNGSYFFSAGSITSKPGTYKLKRIPGITPNAYGLPLSTPFNIEIEKGMTYRGAYIAFLATNNARTYYGNGEIALGSDGVMYLLINNTGEDWTITDSIFYVFLQSKLSTTQLNIDPVYPDNG